MWTLLATKTTLLLPHTTITKLKVQELENKMYEVRTHS
jgi:hypothetical protein